MSVPASRRPAASNLLGPSLIDGGTGLARPVRAVCTALLILLLASAGPGCRDTAFERARVDPPATAPTSAPVKLQKSDEHLAAARAAELRQIYSGPREAWPPPDVDPGVKFEEIGRLPPPPCPADNPPTPEKEALGKQLFFDPRLSGSGQIACASCHDPDLAWADGRTVAFGHDRTALKRNSPAVLFTAYFHSQFWDGRASSLEEQVRMPVTAQEEMNADLATIINRLNGIPGYVQQFKSVFGVDKITMDDVARAVASFERSIARNAGRSKFDKFMGGDADALSDSAVRGLHVFRTKARCMNCHSGPAFTDNQFHDIGLSYYGRKYEDLGRYKVTKNETDVGKFRTPTLRDVGRTGPLMHNGLFDLAGVINMYNAGMPTLKRNEDQLADPLFPTKDPLLKPLHLSAQDRADLKAFLESLSEPPLRLRPPELPPENGP